MREVLRKLVTVGRLLSVVLLTASAAKAPPQPPPWSPGEVSVVEADGGGYAFTNELGIPVYSNDRDTSDGSGGVKIGCTNECIGTFWVPVFARTLAKPMGDWTIVIRPDDRMQWAYKGRPVYKHFLQRERAQVQAYAKEDGHWHEVVP